MLKLTPHRGLGRLLALTLAALVALPPSLPASPAMEKLFYILKQKGSITADEYDLLIATMKAEGQTAPKSAPAASSSAPALEKRLAADEAQLQNLQVALQEQKEELNKISDNTSPATMSKTDLDALLSDKWYERVKLRGYIQNRFVGIMGDDDTPGYNQANDSLASDSSGIGIRRGRLVLSGDVTDHVYLYLQSDYNASVGGSSALQARDIYADISLDPAREFRVRLGLSKVPYGFTNLQSSQNRYALERPDALNSAVEGERDMGAYLIWAPYEKRNLFKDLVKMGLRGSGDYGVLSLGVFQRPRYQQRGPQRRAALHRPCRLAFRGRWPDRRSGCQLLQRPLCADRSHHRPCLSSPRRIYTHI